MHITKELHQRQHLHREPPYVKLCYSYVEQFWKILKQDTLQKV